MTRRRFPVPPSARPLREAGFLAGLSLETLVAPVPRRRFLSDHWDRAPLILNRHLKSFYTGLISLDEVDSALASGRLNASSVDARDGKGRTWARRHGEPATDALLHRFSGGATLILDAAQTALPGLGRMCRLLMAETGHAWHCNLYVTPPGGQGFEAHVDDTGVFILQIEGHKTWWFGHSQIARPIAREGGRPAPLGWEDEAQQAVLGPGDMLYLPRGVPHAAAAHAPESGSFHVTLTVAESSYADVAGESAGNLAADDPLRDLLPIGFQTDAEALAAGVSERWNGAAAQPVETFLQQQARRFEPDVSGRLAAAFRPCPLTDDTEVSPRDDLHWHIGPDPAGGTTARVLTCGPIQLGFPESAEPAIRHLLTRRTRIEGLPGDHPQADRIALAQAVLDHGLVTRRSG